MSVSDLHLRHDPPAAWEGCGDWYRVMALKMQDLKKLADYYCPPAEVLDVFRRPVVARPLFVAGDLFHRWNPPPEIINLAIRNLPRGAMAVPGQHDLPMHVYNDRHRSAYGTLCAAGVIHDMHPGHPYRWPARDLVACGQPWGLDSLPDLAGPARAASVRLAVVHAYCWAKGKSYPGAKPAGHYQRWRDALGRKGYTHLAFGDNHKAFAFAGKGGLPTVVNHGGFYRANRDEGGHRPRAALYLKDGTVRHAYLGSLREDLSLGYDPGKKEGGPAADAPDFAEFREALAALGGHGPSADFEDYVRRAARTLRPRVRRRVIEILEANP